MRHAVVTGKASVTVPIYKMGDEIECSNYRGILLLSTTYKILSSILLSKLTPRAEEIFGIINVDFATSGQLLIIYSSSVKNVRKVANKMRQYITTDTSRFHSL